MEKYDTYKTIIGQYDDKPAWDLEKVGDITDTNSEKRQLNLRFSPLFKDWTNPGKKSASLRVNEGVFDTQYIFANGGEEFIFNCLELEAFLILATEHAKLKEQKYSSVSKLEEDFIS